MKTIIKEFKEFAVRGNVMDMAVGIVIGAAFGKIVSSFVNDVLMPPIGLLMGTLDARTPAAQGVSSPRWGLALPVATLTALTAWVVE